MNVTGARIGLAVLAVTALCGGCSAAAPSPENTYHPEPPPRLSSVALARQVAEPAGAEVSKRCTFDHAVACFEVHAPFAAVQTELAGALRGLDVGGVTLTTLPGAPGHPSDVGASHLDVSDATRHVRVVIISEVVGTRAAPLPAPGIQDVVVQADPEAVSP